jgi:transcriptional regulator with XRE-family HTH domain
MDTALIKQRRRDPDAEPEEVVAFVRALGRRCRLLRIARRMTLDDMAERAECARSTVRAIESGSLSGRVGDLARILWVLDDRGLQRVLADAASDPLYREAIEQALPRLARPSK